MGAGVSKEHSLEFVPFFTKVVRSPEVESAETVFWLNFPIWTESLESSDTGGHLPRIL